MASEVTVHSGGRGLKGEVDGDVLKLDSLEATRETFARIIQLYGAGKVSENQARTFCYLLAGFLSYWKTEKDFDIEARIETIEALLAEDATYGTPGVLAKR